MGVAEVMMIIKHPYGVSFDINSSYENSFFTSSLLILIGQILLFFTTTQRKLIGRIIALLILWMGFFYLIKNMFNGDELSWFSFVTGTPFLGISGTLAVFDVKQYLQIKNQEQEL
jgi:predicted membrane protein